MENIIGSAMIIVASTLLGFWKAFRYAERPRILRHLINGLQMLKTEISYGATPLPVALQKIGDRLPSPAADLFRYTANGLRSGDGEPASVCWRNAVESLRDTPLLHGDREVLLHFGETLGVSDREDQVQHIEQACAALRAEEQNARDEQMKHERMWRYLGALAGIAVVILIN
jgi:stage III sporulation protein AB